MTTEDIIKIAREAGCHEASHPMNPWSVTQEALERFADLVAEQATEAAEWVGLTDEDIKEIIGPWGATPIKGYTRKLFDQIEAKLKEKNK